MGTWEEDMLGGHWRRMGSRMQEKGGENMGERRCLAGPTGVGATKWPQCPAFPAMGGFAETTAEQ